MKQHSSPSSSDKYKVDFRKSSPSPLPSLDQITYSTPSEIRTTKKSKLRNKFNRHKKNDPSISSTVESSKESSSKEETKAPTKVPHRLSYHMSDTDSEEYKVKYHKLPILSNLLLQVVDNKSAEAFCYQMDDSFNLFLQLNDIDFREIYGLINIYWRDKDKIKILQRNVKAKNKTVSTIKKLVFTKISNTSKLSDIITPAPIDTASSILTSSSSTNIESTPLNTNSYSDKEHHFYKKSSIPNENITPLINNISVPNHLNKDSTNETNLFSFNEQYQQINDEFHEGYDQKCYEIGEFNDDFPRYTEDDMYESFQDSHELGIEETIDNHNCIERDRR